MKPVAKGGAETLVALLDSQRGTGSAKTGLRSDNILSDNILCHYQIFAPCSWDAWILHASASAWHVVGFCKWKKERFALREKATCWCSWPMANWKAYGKWRIPGWKSADCCEFAVPELQGEDMFLGMQWLTRRNPDPDWRVQTLTHRQTILSWQTIFQLLKWSQISEETCKFKSDMKYLNILEQICSESLRLLGSIGQIRERNFWKTSKNSLFERLKSFIWTAALGKNTQTLDNDHHLH